MKTLWQRANDIIPGGNHLFSKTPDRYCPGKFPAYMDEAHGIEITTLDGQKFKDFSIMGAGNSELGYCDPTVEAAVARANGKGNISTLNSPEELYFCERVKELVPGMDMVRCGRSGSDACQIALRIAREYSNQNNAFTDDFAICGYHGWQVGHPPDLHPFANPFEYGNAGQLYELLEYGINAVIMEPVRSSPVDVQFLKEVRSLTNEYDVPLIFDEVAVGFRVNFGTFYSTVGVTPDIVLLGKALGNGHPVSAVVGTENVMRYALNVFISSMPWSTREDYAAGLATFDRMKETQTQRQIVHIGRLVKEMWQQAAEEHGLVIHVSGLDSLAKFEFGGDTDRVMITTFTQEMLKKGYLASEQFYPSICHTPDEIGEYVTAMNDIFRRMAAGEVHLEGQPSRPGFRRLA